jgi:hypothetical protein
MLDVAETVCPENKTAFRNMSVSRTTVRCMGGVTCDLLSQLNGAVQTSEYFCMTLLSYWYLCKMRSV